MSTHTPAPWHYEFPSDDKIWIMGPDNHGRPHAIVKTDEWQGGDLEGNARLIAAAPDMLEALKNIENDADQMPITAWILIQNAIAKAEGKEASDV